MKIFWVLLLIFRGDHLFADQATADLSHQHLADWKKKREEVKKILEDFDSKRQKIYTDCDQRVQLIQKKSNLLKKNKNRSQLKKLQSELSGFVKKEKNKIDQNIRLMRQKNGSPELNVEKTSETITKDLNLFSVNCQMNTNGIADKMIEGNPKLPSPQMNKLRPDPIGAPKREKLLLERPALSRLKSPQTRKIDS